ncbi:ATP-binding protein [Streptodolium elevatio]
MERADEGVGAGNRIDIRGNASGAVIAGNHNVVIDAQQGAVVNLVTRGDQPRPVRRERIELLPRVQAAPLGRSAELALLADAVRSGGPVQIWGPPGIGKSSILRHAAGTFSPGADGTVFLSAAHRDPADLAQEIFEACYEAPGYAPSIPELRRLMAGLRVRVYVDNVDLPEEQLRDLMDAAPSATFVLAGRERSLPAEGVTVEVRGLDRAAATELLARELGGIVWENTGAAADLWQAADGRPRLLLRAAALARTDGSAGAALPRPTAVAEVLALLLDRLDVHETNVLRLLASMGDAELAAEHVGALVGVADPAALCARLAALGLAGEGERGFRAVPDVAAATRGRHPDPFPADPLCAYFTDWLSRPSTTAAQVADQARVLEVAAALAEDAGQPAVAVAMLRAASPAAARSLRFGVWGRLLGRGWSAARRAGDPRAAAYFTHQEGIRSLLTGRRVVSAVLLAEAAVIWRQLGEGGTDGGAAGGLGGPEGPGVPQTVPSDGPGLAEGASPAGPGGDGFPGADGLGSGADSGIVSGFDPGASSDQAVSHMAELARSTSLPGADFPGAVTSGAGMTPPPGVPPAATPGPAASGPTPSGSAPPGADSGGSAVPGPPSPGPADPGAAWSFPPGGGQGAGAASGGAAQGAAAGGAATGAKAGSSLTGILVGLAVVGAVVATAVTVNAQKDDDSDDRSSSASVLDLSTTDTGAPSPTGAGSTTRATPTRSASPTANTGLAGQWRDTQGNLYVFVASGPGSFAWRGTNPCGEVISVTMTGSNGTYTGSQPLYDLDSGSCDTTLGTIETTVTVARDGATARLVGEVPALDANDQLQACPACGTQSLTRVSR